MFENDVWSIPILGRAPRALSHVRRLPTAVATPQKAVNVATGSRIRVRALLTSSGRIFYWPPVASVLSRWARAICPYEAGRTVALPFAEDTCTTLLL